MFVEENMNIINLPSRMGRNVNDNNHIAYLRHAKIQHDSFFYKHDVPNGTLSTNKIIFFFRGTKTSFPPNFNNKTTSIAKENNIYFNLITSLETREIKNKVMRSKYVCINSATEVVLSGKLGKNEVKKQLSTDNGNYINQRNHNSDKEICLFSCPVRDNMFVEENMNVLNLPSRMGRNVDNHNHIAYLRHATIQHDSFFYKHCVPDGMQPTTKIISFCRGTKSSFLPNFNNKTTSVEDNIKWQLENHFFNDKGKTREAVRTGNKFYKK
jgi:hypothetical protein